MSGAARSASCEKSEAWTAESAVTILRELERFEIEFCEQPIPAGAPERLRWIRERTAIPLVTDEDSVDARDLAALAGCVDGRQHQAGEVQRHFAARWR